MDIGEINDQIRLKRFELQVTKDYHKKRVIQNKIKKLEYQKEIEIIKDKIRKISSY
jgi:hypothetical protein